MDAQTYSDSLNLKMKELLNEVKFDYSPSTTKLIDDVVSSIKQAIDQIPQGLQVAAAAVSDIGADKVEFTFRKPESIEIGGSYSYRGIAKPDVNIDVYIRLPKECFYEKDYLNYRYHAKRCLYLNIIKKYLDISPFALKIEWSTFHNEARKPILFLYPDMKCHEIQGCSLRLIPTASSSLFSISKLNIQRNNIHSFNQGVLDATPMYSTSILEDMFLEDNTKFVRSTFLGWTELCDALILLKVWAWQRKSIYAHDCLSGYLISSLMSYLATDSSSNRINKPMNIIQIFRTTLDFIANSNSWKKGIFFKPRGESNFSMEERRRYLQSFPAVVCDPFTRFNMAFKMSKSGLIEVLDMEAKFFLLRLWVLVSKPELKQKGVSCTLNLTTAMKLS